MVVYAIHYIVIGFDVYRHVQIARLNRYGLT